MQWMRLSNGREEIIVNKDHVKRLLSEGAVEIDDPRVPQAPEVPRPTTEPNVDPGVDTEQEPEKPQEEASTEEVVDGSTNVNEQSDSPSTPDDQRSGDATAVQRSKRTR